MQHFRAKIKEYIVQNLKKISKSKYIIIGRKMFKCGQSLKRNRERKSLLGSNFCHTLLLT